MMNLAEFFSEIERNNVVVSLVANATLKAEGFPDDIERCRPMLKAYKAEIIDMLTQKALSMGRRWKPGYPFTCTCGEFTGWTTDGDPACPCCENERGKRTESPSVSPSQSGRLKSTLPAEALESFKKGFPWLKAQLPSLLLAGWTRRELIGRGRCKWPYGAWGVAWLPAWGNPEKTASIGMRGEIIFTFTANGAKGRQTAWPKKQIYFSGRINNG